MSTKTLVAVIAGIVVLGVAVFLFSSQSDDFEIMVLDDVSSLEMELAELNAQVSAGTLTPEVASMSRSRIINKLDSINVQMEAAGKAKLTSAQKLQLAAALTRLKDALVSYGDTLVTVDEIAAKHSSMSGGSRSLTSAFLNTVEVSEEATAEADVEVVVDAEVEASLDELEENVAETVDEVVEAAEDVMEEVASTTDEVIEDVSDAIDDTVMVDGEAEVMVEAEADTTTE